MKTNSESPRRSWKNAILLAITALAPLASPGVVAQTPPGGSNTQLQYNNNGAFGGISSVTFDGTIPLTITLAPAANTAVEGIALADNTASTTGNDYYPPFIRFTGHSHLTTDHTVEWRIVPFSVADTPDAGGGALNYIAFQHRQDGGTWGNHYITIDSAGNLSDGGGDAVCTFAQFNILDQAIFGNGSNCAAITAANPAGFL
jgi:hypothetical protein